MAEMMIVDLHYAKTGEDGEREYGVRTIPVKPGWLGDNSQMATVAEEVARGPILEHYARDPRSSAEQQRREKLAARALEPQYPILEWASGSAGADLLRDGMGTFRKIGRWVASRIAAAGEGDVNTIRAPF